MKRVVGRVLRAGKNRIRVIVDDKTGNVITVTEGCPMRITYDPDVDAAYIRIADVIGPGDAAEQIHSIATPGGRGEITLDFDSDGRLLGIEILNAADVLGRDTLSSADPA